MMPKFQKKPVIIEATQWFKNGDHPLDYSKDHEGPSAGVWTTFTKEYRKENDWEGDIVRFYRDPYTSGDNTCAHCGDIMHNHGWIDTLEGGHIVCPGDWIITGVKGEHYPCKPDIFEMTYEPVVEPVKIEETVQAKSKGGCLYAVSTPETMEKINKAMRDGDAFEVTTKVTF